MSPDPTCLFTLSDNDFKNTLIYDSNPEPLYYIETKKSLFHTEPTFIYRRGEKGAKNLVAKMEFHGYKSDRVIMYGEEKKLDDVVPKKGIVMGNRTMPTQSGTFTWKSSYGKPKLVDDSKRTIVNYERHTFTRQKPTLEIGSEVLPYLDLVLVGFVTMSNDIKKREDAASAGS